MTPLSFHNGKVTLHACDCLDALDLLPENSVDSICTDPPYHLTSIVKWFGAESAAPAMSATQRRFAKTGGADRMPGTDQYGRLSTGFMGQQWDGGDIAFRSELWTKMLRVLKPGGHLAAFSGDRTYARMAVAIEDAGFQIRHTVLNMIDPDTQAAAFMNSLDAEQAAAFARLCEGDDFGGMLAWTYGSGFPKSHDVSKGIDKAAGATRTVMTATSAAVKRMIPGADQNKTGWEKNNGRDYTPGVSEPATEAARPWQGWGTALKPAFEPICLARKPLSEKTVAANVLRWGCGALNINGCRVGDFDPDSFGEMLEADRRRFGEVSALRRYESAGATNFAALPDPRGGSPKGRWPATIVHDGSDAVVKGFPDSNRQQFATGPKYGNKSSVNCYGDFGPVAEHLPRGDSGSVARFFYSAKADADDRLGSKHPTVKPVDLMQWLCRLVTPPGGTILDPFAGTGTTGHAALLEGFSAILIEREEKYRDDIARRMALVFAGEVERAPARARNKPKTDLPLFGESP